MLIETHLNETYSNVRIGKHFFEAFPIYNDLKKTRCFIAIAFNIFFKIFCKEADLSGRAVLGVGLRSLACWDCRFESHPGNRCLSLVSVVCCQVDVSASG
jgi:hypothetical protein